MAPDKPGFLEELKRRHVWRVAAAYAIAGWLIVQIATQVFPFFNIPNWGVRLIVILIVIGFPVAVAFAWIYELTPEGIRRTEAADSPEARPASTTRQIGRKLNALIVAVLVLAVALLAWRLIVVRHAEPGKSAQVAAAAKAKPLASTAKASVVPATHVSAVAAVTTQTIPAKSVAVLPFENLSTSKANAYFADGMQDLILTKLADIGDLKVIARTSTQSYGSHPESLSLVGKQLGVATILEGSVQKAGNEVLINVQLIDARTDSHIWAQSYQRNLTNIFGVEGEVADKVATALNAKLTAAESAAVAHVPTTNPQAYDDYLRGLHFDHEAGKGDWTTYLPQAIAAYRKAVEEDPNFALAWAALSNARLNAYYWAGNSSKADLLAADKAAKRALQLDPKLPDAHIAMAGVDRFLFQDLIAAHDQSQQAVALRPNDAGALTQLAISDGNLGIAGGEALLRRAIALNPTDPFNYFAEGLSLATAGDYSRARQAEHTALAIDPQLVRAYLALSEIDISDNQNVDAATKILGHMAPGTPVNATLVSWRIELLLFRRQFGAARALSAKYAGKFASGPGAVKMAFDRANVEWLAGKTGDARALYRTVIGLVTQPGSEISAYGRARLGLAYARIGNAKAAMQESHEALAMAVKSHTHDLPQTVKYVLAESQLALGNKSASVDTLAEVLSMDPRDIRAPWLLFVARMQLDPTWDPIRHDPAFQALLKKYGGSQATPATASTSAAAAPQTR